MFSDTRPLTGRAVLAITLLAFGAVIAANFAMAFYAVSTFPGLEVENSYVASQEFEARATAQRALGWSVAVSHDGVGVVIALRDRAGLPVDPAEMGATVGRLTEEKDDQTLALAFDGTALRAPVTLAPGRWRLRLRGRAADGTAWLSTHDLDVGPLP